MRKKELEENRGRQEEQRIQIERNMAELMLTSSELSDKLKSLNKDTSGVDIESECEMLTMTNIYGSTMPQLLHEDYSTRLEMMKKINESIQESLTRKSRRIAKLTVKKIDTSDLPKKERKKPRVNN